MPVSKKVAVDLSPEDWVFVRTLLITDRQTLETQLDLLHITEDEKASCRLSIDRISRLLRTQFYGQ